MNTKFHIEIEFRLCSVCGFSNALAITEIDDDDIDYIEASIRDISTNSDQNSQFTDDDHLNENQKIVDFFGKQYVQRAAQFKFERGERKMIKQLAAHVKAVIETEGYDRFKYKVPKSTKKRKSRCSEIDAESSKSNEVAMKHGEHNKNPIDNKNSAKLKALLFEKVKACLWQYSVDDHLLETLEDDVVELFEEKSKIYGRIFCVICREKNAKDLEPKSVSYYEGRRSSYWVLSNFTKHLKKHGYEPQRVAKTKRPKLQENRLVANGDIQFDDADYLEDIQSDADTEAAEILEGSIHDVSVVIVADNLPIKDIDADTLYKQFAMQITDMVTESLNNGDTQEQMNFNLNEDNNATLTTTEIAPNGNCLLGSLVHQLHKHPVTSTEHRKATETLRAEICNHILKPENFDSYKLTLEAYISSKTGKNKSKDTTKECQKYVRNILSKNGMWAGAEAIHAASDLHKVNVIVFIEDGDYYMHNYDKNYQTTIAIAYRKGINNLDETQYNHYDSVSDMDANEIHSVVSVLSKAE